MCGLLTLLPTSGENVNSIAPLEIHLLKKMLMCFVLIFPTVCGKQDKWETYQTLDMQTKNRKH